MDRMIYTAMTGAKHILEQQATSSHNLANAATTGFRAQVDQFRAVPIEGAALATRAFVVAAFARLCELVACCSRMCFAPVMAV